MVIYNFAAESLHKEAL